MHLSTIYDFNEDIHFNTTVVRLDVKRGIVTPNPLSDFNTTVVRLDGINLQAEQAKNQNFNTTVVRLDGIKI